MGKEMMIARGRFLGRQAGTVSVTQDLGLNPWGQEPGSLPLYKWLHIWASLLRQTMGKHTAGEAHWTWAAAHG